MKHKLLIGLLACNLAVIPVMAGNFPSNLDSGSSGSDQEKKDPNQEKQDSDKEQAAQSSDASNGDIKEEPSEQNSASDSESDIHLPPLTDPSDSDSKASDAQVNDDRPPVVFEPQEANADSSPVNNDVPPVIDADSHNDIEKSDASSESDNGAGLPPSSDSSSSDSEAAGSDKGADIKPEGLDAGSSSESDNGAGLPPSSDSSSSDSEGTDSNKGKETLDNDGSGNGGGQDPNGPNDPQGPKNPNDPQGPTVLTTLKSYTKTQLAALVGAALIIGYGAYKGYQAAMAWWQAYQEGEQHLQLTMKERAILQALSEAMAEDVKQAYEGKKLPSKVAQFDVGGLRMPVAIQCNYIQTGFIDLYNRCDEQGHNAEALNIFYHQIHDILEVMIEQAEIVAEA